MPVNRRRFSPLPHRRNSNGRCRMERIGNNLTNGICTADKLIIWLVFNCHSRCRIESIATDRQCSDVARNRHLRKVATSGKGVIPDLRNRGGNSHHLDVAAIGKGITPDRHNGLGIYCGWNVERRIYRSNTRLDNTDTIANVITIHMRSITNLRRCRVIAVQQRPHLCYGKSTIVDTHLIHVAFEILDTSQRINTDVKRFLVFYKTIYWNLCANKFSIQIS